jgi:GT2 family glycosyltransferase
MALTGLDFPEDRLEVIVADNGSTDDTRFVAESFEKLFSNFRYLFDPRPGQIVGWHRALAIAGADIIAFIDDDVRPLPRWAAAIGEIFADRAVGLGTGKILPEFGEKPPAWQGEMVKTSSDGTWSALWGMLDFGDSRKDISADFVWGSNFLARKSALTEARGFHPGGMPGHLFHFTGDGDVAAGRAMAALGHQVHYHPDAAVAHHLPASRGGADEVRRWIYGEGLVTSYVALREAAARQPELPETALAAAAAELLGAERIDAIGQGYLPAGSKLPGEISEVMEMAGAAGFDAHRDVFEADTEFRQWVLRPDYLDIDGCYTHPDLQPATESG